MKCKFECVPGNALMIWTGVKGAGLGTAVGPTGAWDANGAREFRVGTGAPVTGAFDLAAEGGLVLTLGSAEG